MKKYLMGGIAAIALCVAFTSCSKSNDIYDAGAVEQQKKQAAVEKKNVDFTQSFTNRYGTIDSNNDWGFDNIGKAATRAAVANRANAYSSSYDFSKFEFPDNDKFLTDTEIPGGVKSFGDECKAQGQTNQISVGVFYVDPSWTDQVKTWGGYDNENQETTGGTAYFKKGVHDYSNRLFYMASNSKIYLLEGAELTIRAEDAANLQEGSIIYMAKDSKLITDGELKLNKGLRIYNNGGYIESGSLSLNEHYKNWSTGVSREALLYNRGKIKTGDLSVTKESSTIINEGNIEASSLHTAGSGHFENTGNVTISGNTLIDSNDNSWVNNGKYHTKNFTYVAGSENVINNCMLTVDELFKIKLGDTNVNGFKVDGGVETKNFEAAGPAYIRMTSNTVFKVTETAKMNITKPTYGIYGPESGNYAVFQAKNIVWESKNNFCVSYFGNLNVVADSHFEHSYLDGDSDAAKANGGVGEKPTYYFDNNVKMYVNGTDKPDYTIAKSECNPGFEGNKQKIEYAVRIICEDLGASDDFDFNDVVFDALMKDGKTYIKVLAAGGTLPLTVAGKEVHDIFNVPTSTMVNTQPNAHYATTTDKQEFVVDQVWSSYKEIPVKVAIDATDMTEESMITLKAEKGAAPQKIAVDTNFEWCDERQQIETKYTNFKEYVQKSGTRWQ